MKIAAVEGSAAAQYLNDERIAFTGFSDLLGALKSVGEGELETVLHTAPELRYTHNKNSNLSLRVQSLKFDPRYYAFAVSPGNPLRKNLNLGLLRVINTGLWQQELDRFVPEKK